MISSEAATAGFSSIIQSLVSCLISYSLFCRTVKNRDCVCTDIPHAQHKICTEFSSRMKCNLIFFLITKAIHAHGRKIGREGKNEQTSSHQIAALQTSLSVAKSKGGHTMHIVLYPAFLFINIQWLFFPLSEASYIISFNRLQRILQFNQFSMVQHFTLLSKWRLFTNSIMMHSLVYKSFSLSLIISLV